MLRAIQFLCRCCSDAGDAEESGRVVEVHVEKNYEIAEMIGKGRLGVVYKCIRRSTGEQLACKKMPITKNACDEMGLLEDYLSGKHPGILEVSACYWVPRRLGQNNLPKNLYMISELCHGGDLQRFLERNGIPSRGEAARIMKCIVEALRYCHSQRIIHRDVKPSSIFISQTESSGSSWVVKLGNFDRSILVPPWNAPVFKQNVGTLGYSAPEMLSGNGYGYSYKVDIWSAGVVLYVLLCGKKPFDAKNEDPKSMYDKIQNTEPDVSTGEWSSISESTKELVLGMLKKDMDQRLSWDEILSHPWILSNAAEMDIASVSTVNAEMGSTPTSADDATN